MRITGNGLRIAGNGIRFGGAPAPAGLFTPTGSPMAIFEGSDFEMGVWDSGTNYAIPDLSGNNHTLELNDSTYSGDSRYYHFLNNSAQASNWDWPADGTSNLAIMGWFAFANNLSGNVSLVSRNDGGNGWALRIDSSGTSINLVKYNVADQNQTIPSLTPNQWHFIGVAQSGSNLEYVIDGTVYTSTGSSTPFASSGGPVRLQYDPYNGGNQNTEMWMRDVKVFSASPLSGTDLVNIWNTQKSNYGISNTSTPPYSAVQDPVNSGSNAIHIDTSYSWASSVPVGATIVADGFGPYTVTGINAPGTYGSNWFFEVSPSTSNFPGGTNLTFNW